MATSAFGKAFRKAYDAGEKEFTFNGKKYNTKMADEMPKLSNEGQTMPKADTGQARLKNIPKLPDSYSKTISAEEKDEIGRTLKRELPTAKYAPQKFNRTSMSFSSPADKGLDEFMPSKVSTKESLSEGETAMKRGGSVKSHASKRADGIAQRGHTKGRYL